MLPSCPCAIFHLPSIRPIWMILLGLLVITSTRSDKEGLPFCDNSLSNKRYLFVSTLDGKLTALNPNNGGEVLWTIHPGAEPMLSSSIHLQDVTHYGELVRMIPALSGGLYMFNGETLEQVPWTAEKLLKTSFRYADDLVMTGGKHSQTFGVSLQTGQLLYECSMAGCSDDSFNTSSEGHKTVGDILLIQKTSQVVRAVEARSGSERWNFSVAQHDLRLMSECHVDRHAASSPLNLKTVIPEGLICAMDETEPSQISWKHKFSSPVVAAWEILKGEVHDINLFNSFELIEDGPTPSLYLGMHDKQLYIQESALMIRQRQDLVATSGNNFSKNKNNLYHIPWKPIAADSKSLGVSEDKTSKEVAITVDPSKTALSAMYRRGNDFGFYLYSADDFKKRQNALCNVSIDPPLEIEAGGHGSNETPVTIVIVSLWYWWREVFVISITTAILFNFLFTRRYLARTLAKESKSSSLEEPDIVSVSKASNSSSSGHEQLPQQQQPLEYTSRYLADFEPIACLGRGGFGVVFQAKNKIDACHYAVKRIVLPENLESRERVLREVRALAQLDHHHIVRYFNCWVESPPEDWQKDWDRQWLHNDELNSLPTSYQESTQAIVNCKNCDSIEDEDDDDSFIVFANQDSLEDPPKEHSVLIEPSSTTETTEITYSVKKRKRTDSSLCQSSSRLYLYIQMQLCQRESLKDWLVQNDQRDYQYVIKMFQQIVDAVEYVHQHGLIHRDLKPSNIFFSKDQQIKIGDFGLVTFHSGQEREGDLIVRDQSNGDRHTARVGTHLYMSPEQLSGKHYNSKVDIFALGLIFFELLVPFGTQMERQEILTSLKQRRFPVEFPKQFRDEHELLNLMLSDNPDERPTTCAIKSKPPLSKSLTEFIG